MTRHHPESVAAATQRDIAATAALGAVRIESGRSASIIALALVFLAIFVVLPLVVVFTDRPCGAALAPISRRLTEPEALVGDPAHADWSRRSRSSLNLVFGVVGRLGDRRNSISPARPS